MRMLSWRSSRYGIQRDGKSDDRWRGKNLYGDSDRRQCYSGYRTKYNTELYPGEISVDWRSYIVSMRENVHCVERKSHTKNLH